MQSTDRSSRIVCVPTVVVDVDVNFPRHGVSMKSPCLLQLYYFYSSSLSLSITSLSCLTNIGLGIIRIIYIYISTGTCIFLFYSINCTFSIPEAVSQFGFCSDFAKRTTAVPGHMDSVRYSHSRGATYFDTVFHCFAPSLGIAAAFIPPISERSSPKKKRTRHSRCKVLCVGNSSGCCVLMDWMFSLLPNGTS